MPCNCIDDLDAKLGSEHCVNATMAFARGSVRRAIVGLIRKDKWTAETRRGKPSFVQAEFCPWCGERYVDGAAAKPDAA